MGKHAKLNAHIKELEKEGKRMASRLQRAKDAQARAEQDLASMMADLDELQQQVGPVVKCVEAARENAQAAQVLVALVARAHKVAGRLGIEPHALPTEGNSDVATYLSFFGKLVTGLQRVMTSVDDLVDDGSHELLGLAVGRIFANLAYLQPVLDFATVPVPVPPRRAAELSVTVWPVVEEYIQCFKTVEVEEEDDDGEEDAEDEDDEAADGENDSSPVA